MRGRAKPITADERRARIERAKSIMAAQKIDAIVLTGGTSLVYFTGIRWGGSERHIRWYVNDGADLLNAAIYVRCKAFPTELADVA